MIPFPPIDSLTQDRTLLRDVAANVLRVLDGGDDRYIDNALNDYVWAIEQVERGLTRSNVVHVIRSGRRDEIGVQAREARDRANAETTRLRLMRRDALRAELAAVAGLVESVAA